ncbi:MAG TPA: DinB family protein [Thermoanaerobaculia bacterium]|nr:DinB family protein [Thermoanaerobaculia bacterium]
MFLDTPSFVEYWRKFRGRTMRVLDVLPPEDLEWTYAPGKYTFGDIFRHLPGIERYMYGETVRHRPIAYPGHSAALASGVEGVRAYAQRCHEEALEIFGALTLEDLQSKCLTAAGTPITVWKWLRAMVEHEAHHRGQLYMMAGMRGISVPPLYGLTEEEVASLSRPSVGDLRQ